MNIKPLYFTTATIFLLLQTAVPLLGQTINDTFVRRDDKWLIATSELTTLKQTCAGFPRTDPGANHSYTRRNLK